MVEIWKRFFLGNLAAVRTPNELGHRWLESTASPSRYPREVVGAAKQGTAYNECRRGGTGVTQPAPGSS
jgi:hypothetical protein